MSTSENHKCSKELSNALTMIGDEWLLTIVFVLSHGSLRFNEIQRAIPELCPATLTNRLKRLEQERFVSREEETVDKVSVVYSLTEKGRGILPILNQVEVFAKKYLR